MIARALMNELRLLILDEPTAGVDIELRHTLWAFLKNLNESSTTIILSTHYLEEAEHLCKNIAIIDQGDIIENANMKTLLNQLNTQTLVLDLELPLWQPLSFTGFTSTLVDSTTLEVKVPRGLSMNDLFQQLSAQGIKVTGLRNKTNRLEE